MRYRSLSFCLTVEDEQASQIAEEFENLIDSLIVRGHPVFDTETSDTIVCDVEDAEALLRELTPRKLREKP